MKQKGNRHKREFDRRQAIEWLLLCGADADADADADVYDMFEFVTRMLWRSSHWWEHVVKSTFTQNFRMSESTRVMSYGLLSRRMIPK